MKQRSPTMRLARSIHDITLSREALVFSVLVTALTILWFTPARDGSVFEKLLATITQDRVLAEVNPHRAVLGRQPLSVDGRLTEAARLKAEDMLARDYFSHYGPEGEKPWVWFDRVGYQFSGAGENLALDFSDPASLVSAWIASPSHAANIENGLFTDIGIGVASGEFQGRDTTVVVMFLGKPFSGTFAAAAPTVPTPASSPVEEPPPPQPAPTPPPTQSTPQPSQPSEPPVPPANEPPAQEPVTPPVIVAETEPEMFVASPLVSENVLPQETFITVKGPASGPLATNAPVPVRTTLLEFLLLKAAFAMRWALSAAFGTTVVASAALFAMPSHRAMVKRVNVFTLVLLLGLLWLPEFL